MVSFHRTVLQLFAVCLSVVALICAGCDDAGTADSQSPAANTDGDHDHNGHSHSHDDEPETVAEAVKILSEIRDEIRDAFKEDKAGDAHDPLHEVGHVLEDLESLVGKSELSDEDKTEAKEAVNTLFDLFTKIDDKYHGKEGAEYDDVADKIDEAIKTLESKAEPSEEEAEGVSADSDTDESTDADNNDESTDADDNGNGE